MRVLILGGTGMLGHKLVQYFHDRYEVYTTLRGRMKDYAHYQIFDADRTLENVDAYLFDSMVDAISRTKPDVIINCIGIIKQLAAARDPIVSLTINSLLPHRLANICRTADIRLLHISTDCVFNGKASMYTEDSPSNAEDLYGRSKFLGEVSGENSLTLRTSIIGRELNSATGLVEWFLSNRGKRVKGFRQAIYNGLTTTVLAKVVQQLIDQHPNLSGLYQVSSESISKYDLLLLLREHYNVNVEIDPDDAFKIDRSLDSTRFWQVTGIKIPAWNEMIAEMAHDPTPYDSWNK